MEKKYLFDKPENVKKVLRGFWGVLLVLLIIDFFIIKHPHFAWEYWPEFYAVFGFVIYACIVIAAKHLLRPLIKREEDYYD